jgi:hypothetical protein
MNEPTPALPSQASRVEMPPPGENHPLLENEALFDNDSREGFRKRWSDVQGTFVDEPRRSVEHADALLREVIDRLTRTFSDQRIRLEQAWDRDGEASTEDLRRTLMRYHAFFDKLLSV